MSPRYSASQLRSKLRQFESKRRQAVNKYNQAVRQHNQKVRQHKQKVQNEINRYNQAVRVHNARVRANRQRLKSEITRLSRHATSSMYSTFRISVDTVQRAYVQLDKHTETYSQNPRFNYLADLSEREAANSAAVANALFGKAEDQQLDQLDVPRLAEVLSDISPDLHKRWEGAVYALKPENPEASRHFCTSAREIFSEILEIRAPGDIVKQELHQCEFTDRGDPTRRSKIIFLLQKNQISSDTLGNFVEADIENIIELFEVFNRGTHGSVGKFNHAELSIIQKRVEDGIAFLAQIAAPTDD